MWSFVWNFKDPATVYAYSLIFVHHQVVWFMILILAIVYWSFFCLIRDYNWFSFNKQMGSIFFLTYKIRYALDNLSISFLAVSRLLAVPFFYYKLIIGYNGVWLLIWVYYWDFMRWRLEYYPSAILLLCNYACIRMSLTFHTLVQGEFLYQGLEQNSHSTLTSWKKAYENNKLDNYVYYYFFNRSANAYVFSAHDREDKDFLLAQSFRDNILLEYIWAIFPSIIIFLILIPSLYLLYSLEENLEPKFNVKVIGHQWFWSYEFDVYDLNLAVEFESNIIPESDLILGARRLLEVDNRLYLPVNVPLRILITSTDVLHSWAVPEMGIKVDAVPGRLNDAVTLIRRPGVFYGQCSELCGVGHGFMPIVVEACSYKKWLDLLANS